MPAIEDAAHIRAAEIGIREENAWQITAILEGRYTDHYLQSLGADAPVFTPDEMKTISAPIDFLGINIYTTREAVPSDAAPGYQLVDRPASYPHMASDWIDFNPQAVYWTPKLVSSLWGVKSIYITENGCSSDDVVRDGPNAEKHVLDTDRVLYLRNYLSQLQRAAGEGVPLHGYFLWSLLDNFEWSSGYSKRFGITYVDFETQRRIPKLSYDFYKEVIRSNSVV
jgi:beta-glucosidase